MTFSEISRNGYFLGIVVFFAIILQSTVSQAYTHILYVTGIRLKTALQVFILLRKATSIFKNRIHLLLFPAFSIIFFFLYFGISPRKTTHSEIELGLSRHSFTIKLYGYLLGVSRRRRNHPTRIKSNTYIRRQLTLAPWRISWPKTRTTWWTSSVSATTYGRSLWKYIKTFKLAAYTLYRMSHYRYLKITYCEKNI